MQMRKTALLLLMLLCLASTLMHAAAEEEIQYKADVWFNCSMRREASEGSYRLLALKEKDRLNVLEYGEDWCHVSFKGSTGYVKTNWLARFRSMDPLKYPVPGYTDQYGLATATSTFFVRTQDYDGTWVQEGSILAVQQVLDDGRYELAVARASQAIHPLYVSFTPFPAWQDAHEGQVIYAFTTYYNDHFAKKLNAERQFNIEEGCRRINGTKVDPGKQFSFNQLCYPYSKSNGYKKAPNISKAGYGFGGGVCQISTTLYNCVLGLPLRVDKWEVHRSNGVSYAPQHFDSAVGDYSDLAFTNLLPYQIIVEAYSQNGTLTTLIRAGAGAPKAEEPTDDVLLLDDEETVKLRVCDPDHGETTLYQAPSADAPLMQLPVGLTVNAGRTENGFRRITAGDCEGWLPESFLYDPMQTETKKATVKLKVRMTPSADSQVLVSASKGSAVTVLNQGAEWSYVTVGGSNGFVLSKYLK